MLVICPHSSCVCLVEDADTNICSIILFLVLQAVAKTQQGLLLLLVTTLNSWL